MCKNKQAVYRVLHSDVYLYVSEKPPRGQKTLGETWTALINSYKQHHRVGCGNKMHAFQKGPEPGSVYTQKGAMKDVLARCLKKTDVQVCTLTSVYLLFCNCNIRALAAYVPSYDQQLLSLYVYKFVTVL
jgi:hypothetical protein